MCEPDLGFLLHFFPTNHSALFLLRFQHQQIFHVCRVDLVSLFFTSVNMRGFCHIVASAAVGVIPSPNIIIIIIIICFLFPAVVARRRRRRRRRRRQCVSSLVDGRILDPFHVVAFVVLCDTNVIVANEFQDRVVPVRDIFLAFQ